MPVSFQMMTNKNGIKYSYVHVFLEVILFLQKYNLNIKWCKESNEDKLLISLTYTVLKIEHTVKQVNINNSGTLTSLICTVWYVFSVYF